MNFASKELDVPISHLKQRSFVYPDLLSLFANDEPIDDDVVVVTKLPDKAPPQFDWSDKTQLGEQLFNLLSLKTER